MSSPVPRTTLPCTSTLRAPCVRWMPSASVDSTSLPTIATSVPPNTKMPPPPPSITLSSTCTSRPVTSIFVDFGVSIRIEPVPFSLKPTIAVPSPCISIVWSSGTVAISVAP
ncbi:hypothetical protein BDO18943_05446 [Burkholderia dolosa]|nr:hypothetical protein BDO18943_05446 [Burkholderia dolosa]